jgi:hypothetical protein
MFEEGELDRIKELALIKEEDLKTVKDLKNYLAMQNEILHRPSNDETTVFYSPEGVDRQLALEGNNERFVFFVKITDVDNEGVAIGLKKVRVSENGELLHD